MIYPTINLNGTAPGVLHGNLLEALCRVESLRQQIVKCEPNSRDYPDGVDAAITKHCEYYKVLADMDKSLTDMLFNVNYQL